MDSTYFANLIASAPTQNSSQYFEAGMYLVEIDNCKIFLNRQRRPRAAVDVTVIDSNNVKFPQTTQLSWVVSLDSDSGPSTVKTFITDLMGCQPHEVTGEVMLKTFINVDDPEMQGKQSIAVGLKATVNAYEKTTKSGGVFTKLSWKGFNPETDEKPDFRSMPQVGQPAVSVATNNNDWGAPSAPQNSAAGGWGAPVASAPAPAAQTAQAPATPTMPQTPMARGQMPF